VNSCKRIKYLATRRHRVGIAKYINAFFGFYLAKVNTLTGNQEKNSPVNITTERVAPSVIGALQLDIGVAGIGISGR